MPASNTNPAVAVVVCSYNGSEHLHDQLASLASQTWPASVYLFDDASSDNTVDIARSFQSKLDIQIHQNSPNKGFVANFESGIRTVLNLGFDYVALCDQDDIWLPNRLDAGMQALLNVENTNQPLLVHSDLSVINEHGNIQIDSYFKFRRYDISDKKSLPIALGQNGVMGNTILMNRKLAELALPFPAKLHVHDFWISLVCELYGTRLLISDQLVHYRIHADNTSNATSQLQYGVRDLSFIGKLKFLWNRDYKLPYKEDSRQHIVQALLNNQLSLPELDAKQRYILETFNDYLTFRYSRLKFGINLLKYGFFKKDWRYRLWFMYSLLLTKRYKHSD
jgi:glycosyltransferase involved in cell wall biosynthesis